MDEREIQESVIKMRYIEQQVDLLKKNIDKLTNVMIETMTSINALKEMTRLKADKESKIPLGAGVFVEATLKKQDNVLIEVGEGVIVEKPIKEALEELEKREKEIKENIENFQNSIQQMQNQYLESAQKVQEYRENKG